MAPVEPVPQPKGEAKPEPAVATPKDIDEAKPETVYWRRYYYWRRPVYRRYYWRRRWWY
jgi:hypothetical protein